LALEGDAYPNVPDHCKAGLAVAHADKVLAKFKGDTSVVLDRLRNGERAVDIAKDLGVSHVALYAFLLRNSPEEWKAISAGKALARIEQAENDMDSATDQTQISKARESHRMGAWAAERVARSIYGETKNGSGDITVQVLIQRDGEVQTNVVERD
jgi:hypothetical protein